MPLESDSSRHDLVQAEQLSGVRDRSPHPSLNTAGRAHGLAKRVVVEDLGESRSERSRVAHLDEPAGYAILHEFGQGSGARGNDGQTGGHRLDHDDAERFLLAGVAEAVCHRILPCQGEIADTTHEDDAVRNPE